MTEPWNEPPPGSESYSFDEWALYYGSTEKVTDRRLALNSTNFSISLALLVGIGVLTNWAVTHVQLRALALGGVLLIAVVGALFCRLWVAQIADYKKLNGSKFNVLSYMAPYVRFAEGASVRSADPFTREWRNMSERGDAVRIPIFGRVALPSSLAEFVVPSSAAVVFVAIAVVTSAVIVLNWRELSRDALVLPTIEQMTALSPGGPPTHVTVPRDGPRK